MKKVVVRQPDQMKASPIQGGAPTVVNGNELVVAGGSFIDNDGAVVRVIDADHNVVAIFLPGTIIYAMVKEDTLPDPTEPVTASPVASAPAATPVVETAPVTASPEPASTPVPTDSDTDPRTGQPFKNDFDRATAAKAAESAASGDEAAPSASTDDPTASEPVFRDDVPTSATDAVPVTDPPAA